MGLFGNDDQIRSLTRQVTDLKAQVQRLTAVVELLAREQGVSTAALAAVAPAEEPWVDEARRMKAETGPIAAIKLVRERTGMGLREAKEAVDRL
ncbi:hypothetical protein GCM10009584_23780 [Ornithinimicrobium humiphilum]|uniref:Ribosomal L7/L12-like protein n=1 Tax=Ornithinimicrobium humiphilum TaxID=125288 RepID=A0A543KMP0_9MICO|nr:ribosomal protein L7/L12 [Ornithinimicrobium humiphilum]TQM96329.1 ribosomal L7/L12-like protein [Ornithinimicrobium humiphilum]